MLRKLIYAALVVGVLGGAYAYREWNRKPESSSEKKADITITAADLTTQYDQAVHLGKMIEVKGKVSSIETENGVTNIALETADPMAAVSCEMEKGSQVPTVKQGDEVTLRGQCDGRLSDVILTRCVLVK
jgi:hypothetical protein